MIRPELLRACALFAQLPEDALLELSSCAGRRVLQRREILFSQGEPATTLFLLLSGQIKLSLLNPQGQEVTLRFVAPGDAFALIAAVPGASYPVTAEAVGISELASWYQPALLAVTERFPSLTRQAMRVVTERMRELQSRFRELATEPVPQRLARALLRLCHQSGRPAGGEMHLDLRLSRQDLAELTGTTLFTVSRILSQWEAEGLVRTGRELVVVRSIPGLAALAAETTEAGDEN